MNAILLDELFDFAENCKPFAEWCKVCAPQWRDHGVELEQNGASMLGTLWCCRTPESYSDIAPRGYLEHVAGTLLMEEYIRHCHTHGIRPQFAA